MRHSSERSVQKPKKGISPPSAGKAHAGDTPHMKARNVPEAKGVKAKITPGRRQDRHPTAFGAISGALEGSSVMAHDAVMKGVPGSTLTRIWESTIGSLPADAILKAIGVSARTAHRIKAAPDKPLDARTTDGIYRLESVRLLAQEVLGSVEAADEWLNAEAIGLEFRKPINLLSTSPGVEAVKTLLQRMKYGVYA